MKTECRIIVTSIAFALFVAVLSASCATRPAPGIKGRWKAVNHYADTVEVIPLSQTYDFYSSPMDETLKGMLTRWAADTGRVLSYRNQSDFTLYAPVAEIRTADLQEAITLLAKFYSEQHVSITADSTQIIVVASADGREVNAQ